MTKGERREEQRRKRSKMVVDGRSVKTVLAGLNTVGDRKPKTRKRRR